MTFSGKNFFCSKVPEFLHVLFNLVVKHSPVFFLAGLRFVSEKNGDKTIQLDVLVTYIFAFLVNYATLA